MFNANDFVPAKNTFARLPFPVLDHRLRCKCGHIFDVCLRNWDNCTYLKRNDVGHFRFECPNCKRLGV